MNWQHPEQYEWLATLSAHGFAWEFLRRNTAFRKAADLSNSLPKITTDTSARFMSHNADSDGAKSWGLLQFESPRIDARGANVFWNPESCPSVLPVVTCSDAGRASGRYLDVQSLHCRTTILQAVDCQDVLCASEGRFLQLSVVGKSVVQPVQVLVNVLPSTTYPEVRWRSFKRLNDLARTKMLRSEMYPPDLGAGRLSRVLRALDGHLVGASQREIAVALFGKERVDADWSHPGAHLRDQVRRAIRRGRDLMNGGYLKLLR